MYDDVKLLKDREEKLARTCHAETNALFNAVRAGVSVAGCRIYVNKFPCFNCCKAIVQAGLKKIYEIVSVERARRNRYAGTKAAA